MCFFAAMHPKKLPMAGTIGIGDKEKGRRARNKVKKQTRKE